MGTRKPPSSRIAGRDNDTGEFVKVEETYRRPSSTTREHLPLPGHGDTGRYEKDDKKSNEAVNGGVFGPRFYLS